MSELTGTSGFHPADCATSRAVQSAGQSAQSKAARDLRKACEQFEAIFAKQLLTEMRKGGDDPLAKTPGGEIYRDMMDQAVAEAMAKQGSLGIGKLLYKQFQHVVLGDGSPTGGADESGASAPHSKS